MGQRGCYSCGAEDMEPCAADCPGEEEEEESNCSPALPTQLPGTHIGAMTATSTSIVVSVIGDAVELAT
jgi:hypothetical protein